MTEENSSDSSGCLPKIVDSWRTLFSALNIGHQVHPLGPIGTKDCEYIVIDSKIQIRVIHVRPDNTRRTLVHSEVSPKRNSLLEEYWFTRNRPTRNGSCNCSFRRSMRYSIVSEQPTVHSKGEKNRDSLLMVDLPPTKIKNVETFLERLIEDTIFEAFQEYYISNKETGKINLAYESTEDDIVTLRHASRPNIEVGNNFARKVHTNMSHQDKAHCVHKRKTQNKPLIVLMHGIGSSADIWWNLINNFVSRGFEVVAPDMLGHGYSSSPNKPSYYTFNNLLIQAISVFDYYVGTDEKRKCILIGHQYGCSLITALYPHRVPYISQIILISGGGPTPLAPPVRDNEISQFGCFHNVFYPLLCCGLKRSFFYLSRGKHFQSCNIDSAVPSHIMNYIINGQKWSEGDAAFHRRIMVPTLLIHGLQDKNITLVQECEMERTMPRAFLELLPNAGHMPMLDSPEHITHMIMCFLDMWS